MSSLQFSVDVRNAQLEAIETTIGTDPVMKLFTGAKPADCATPDAGVVVTTIALPSDWLDPASSGSKPKSGTWQDLLADNDGTPGYFRIYDSGGACQVQGTVAGPGGSADLILDNDTLAQNQPFTVQTFRFRAGNA